MIVGPSELINVIIKQVQTKTGVLFVCARKLTCYAVFLIKTLSQILSNVATVLHTRSVRIKLYSNFGSGCLLLHNTTSLTHKLYFDITWYHSRTNFVQFMFYQKVSELTPKLFRLSQLNIQAIQHLTRLAICLLMVTPAMSQSPPIAHDPLIRGLIGHRLV